jgi:hypothetical protein
MQRPVCQRAHLFLSRRVHRHDGTRRLCEGFALLTPYAAARDTSFFLFTIFILFIDFLLRVTVVGRPLITDHTDRLSSHARVSAESQSVTDDSLSLSDTRRSATPDHGIHAAY